MFLRLFHSDSEHLKLFVKEQLEMPRGLDRLNLFSARNAFLQRVVQASIGRRWPLTTGHRFRGGVKLR